MIKIIVIYILLLIPSISWAEDYWVYIKDKSEITSSDRISGTSQKGDIVDIIPCSRLGKNEPSELEKKEWFIIKVSGITEAERNAMLAPYTETKTVDGREVTTILAYRKSKIDIDSYKTTQSIDSKTSFVTTSVAKTAVVTTEKTTSDITAMQREAKLYDRTMPIRQLVKWGWEKILTPAYAANTINTVNPGGGADYASLSLAEDGIDGTSYNAGDTATINCSGSTADTTTVDFNGWDADVSIIVNGDYAITSGTHYSTNYYRLETTSGATIEDYTGKITFNKIQTKTSGSAARSGIIFRNTGSGWVCSINRCIIVGETGSGSEQHGINMTAATGASTVTITNSIIYGFQGASSDDGITINDADITCTIKCCTIYDCRIGIDETNGTSNIYNCTVFGNTDDFANVAGTINYCASDDGDGTNAVNISPGAIEADDWVLAFTSYSTFDFHIKNTGVLYDSGADLFLTVTTDIDSDTITARNDIGADEYVSASGVARRCILIL